MRRVLVFGFAAGCSAFGSASDNAPPDVDAGADAEAGTDPFSGTVVDVSKSSSADSIVTDKDNVYWSDRVDGVVRAAPKTGGQPSRQVSTSGFIPDYLLIDGDTLYWALTKQGCPSHEHVLSHSTSQTGAPTALWGNDSICYTTWRITGDPSRFFYVQRDSSIVSMSRSGAQTDLVGGEDIISGLAGDGLGVYWTAANSIRTVAVGEKVASPFVENLANPVQIAIDQTGVFWTDAAGSIQRVDRSNGKALPTKLATGTGVQRIALDADNLYFTDKKDSTVKSVPKKGGDVRVLASKQNTPEAIAVDDTGVWWSNQGDGTIRGVRR